MEISCKEARPHPQLLDALFAFKSKVGTIFRDVLGIHEINHISITRINIDQEILCFSSTPALEFNLFSSQLWHYDKSYHPEWFQQGLQTDWRSLYLPERYDELYYLKQIKPHYALGYSLAAKQDDIHYIYSLASRSPNELKELLRYRPEEFYRIGQYCSNMLAPLFNSFATKETQVEYETSN